MSDVTDIGTLQSAAEYATVRRSVKTFGIVALVLGAIHVILGTVPPSAVTLVAFGGLLVGAGLYNLVAPRPVGLALAGSLLVIIGVLNVVHTVSVASAGVGGAYWALIGTLQVVWGVKEFMRFRRFRHSYASKPDDYVLEYAQEMIAGLARAKSKTETDVLEFVSGARAVRIRLMHESALCLVGRGDDVLLVTPEQIEIEDSGEAMLGKKRKVKLSVGTREFKGHMSRDFVERFRTWKLGSALGQAA